MYERNATCMSVSKWCLQNMDQRITNYTVQVGLNFVRYSTVVSLVFGRLEERTDVSPYCIVHKLLVLFPGAGKQAIPVLHGNTQPLANHRNEVYDIIDNERTTRQATYLLHQVLSSKQCEKASETTAESS